MTELDSVAGKNEKTVTVRTDDSRGQERSEETVTNETIDFKTVASDRGSACIRADGFFYTYSALSADERREVEEIRKQYDCSVSDCERKTERLKALDRRINFYPKLIAWTLVVCGVLLFGLGMTFVLKWNHLVYGSIFCVVGAILTALAEPLRRIILKRFKRIFGERVLKLSAEILNETHDDESKGQ